LYSCFCICCCFYKSFTAESIHERSVHPGIHPRAVSSPRNPSTSGQFTRESIHEQSVHEESIHERSVHPVGTYPRCVLQSSTQWNTPTNGNILRITHEIKNTFA
jgi:hypothetical protein